MAEPEKLTPDCFPTLVLAAKSARIGRADERLADALSTLREGFEAGGIANVEFEEIKFGLGRLYEHAFEITVQKAYLEEEGRKDEREVHDLYYSSAYIHLVGSLEKKALKVKGPSPTAAAALRLAEEMKPLAEAMAEAKTIIVKRHPKPKEELDAPYEPPAAARPAVEKTRAVLEPLTQNSLSTLVETLKTRLWRRLDDFRAEYGRLGHPPRMHNYFRKEDALQGLIARCYEFENNTRKSPIRFKPEAYQILETEARRQGEAIREAFVQKTISKLASIFEAKPELEKVTLESNSIDLAGFSARLKFDFADGSSFTLQNATVLSFSVYGKPYTRFPSTFHDVVLPDGSVMREPSEQKMNEEFVRAELEAPGLR